MTRNKCFSLITCALLIAAVLLCAVLPAGAAEKAQYVNPDTNFKILIIDDDKLLTDAEKQQLAAYMKPVTAYGNVAFWTTQEYASDEIDQARLKRKELFGYESAAIFVINMHIRKLTIQSYGKINDALSDSLARSITNNVSHYATAQDYYECARNAYLQMYDVVEGRTISEPMKITSYVVIACMLGLIIALAAAFSKRSNPLLQEVDPSAHGVKAEGCFEGQPQMVFVSSTVEHQEPVRVYSRSGSSCSSCSSGSSCSSCSSCSSGSSCSSCGGGGCGSGGSSSF